MGLFDDLVDGVELDDEKDIREEVNLDIIDFEIPLLNLNTPSLEDLEGAYQLRDKIIKKYGTTMMAVGFVRESPLGWPEEKLEWKKFQKVFIDLEIKHLCIDVLLKDILISTKMKEKNMEVLREVVAEYEKAINKVNEIAERYNDHHAIIKKYDIPPEVCCVEKEILEYIDSAGGIFDIYIKEKLNNSKIDLKGNSEKSKNFCMQLYDELFSCYSPCNKSKLFPQIKSKAFESKVEEIYDISKIDFTDYSDKNAEKCEQIKQFINSNEVILNNVNEKKLENVLKKNQELQRCVWRYEGIEKKLQKYESGFMKDDIFLIIGGVVWMIIFSFIGIKFLSGFFLLGTVWAIIKTIYDPIAYNVLRSKKKRLSKYYQEYKRINDTK